MFGDFVEDDDDGGVFAEAFNEVEPVFGVVCELLGACRMDSSSLHAYIDPLYDASHASLVHDR